MSEISYYWGGTTVGDATSAPYSDDNFSDIWKKLFNLDNANRCVIEGYANELAVSTSGTVDVQVATGAALVDGKFYENDAEIDVAIPTPSTSTRYDLIVLKKDFSAQTVRVFRVAGTEGAAAPTVTQIDGVNWQVSLATVKITTGGAITIESDDRDFVRSPLRGDEWGHIYLSAGGGKSTTTSGCEVATQSELGTNDVDIVTLNFDATSKEYAVFTGFRMPPDWDGGAIYASFEWTHAAAASFGVRFGCAAQCYADGDAMDAAYGTAQEVSDTGGTTNDYYQTGETPAITVGGSPAANRFAIIRIYRDPTHGDDNLNVDAKLLGARIRYKRN